MFSTTFLILFTISIFLLFSLSILDWTKKIKQEKMVKAPIRIKSSEN